MTRYAQFEFRSAEEAQRAYDLLYMTVIPVTPNADNDPAAVTVPLSDVADALDVWGLQALPAMAYFERGDDDAGHDAFMALSKTDIAVRADQPVNIDGRARDGGQLELEYEK